MSAQTVSKIEPISINLFLRNTPVSQMGFGLPLILGVKEPTYSLQVPEIPADLFGSLHILELYLYKLNTWFQETTPVLVSSVLEPVQKTILI